MLSELFSRHRGLALVGVLNVAAAGVFLALSLVDDTTVLGLNRWIKPTKFALSVGIYVASTAWFLPYVRVSRRTATIYGWVVALVMLLENGLIYLQAIRGTTSHYNISTAFDASVFSSMGALIAINSVLAALFLAWLFFKPAEAPRPWLWGVRLGLLLLLLGSAQGGMMITNGSHTIGAPDGGPGLPWLSWSTEHGDLRPAHLVWLHALQVLPLFAFWLGRTRMPTSRQTALVWLFALGYSLVGLALQLQAQSGSPLWPIAS